MWAALLAALRARIAEGEADLDVRVGADTQVPEARRVVLIRGQTSPGDSQGDTGDLEQTVFIECWEHDLDDPAAAYARLDALEQVVTDQVLARGPRLLPDWDTILSVENTQSDNDAFRPSVGSRTTVRVRARRRSTPD